MDNILYFLKLKKIVNSKTDSTIKYIFYSRSNQILEFSYINKNDGKNIICVPSQSMCNVGCKFCHTTEYIGKISPTNISSHEIIDGIRYIYEDLKLDDDPKTLLISFMGCGEPIKNMDYVVETMNSVRVMYQTITVRYAIATSLPDRFYDDFFKMTKYIEHFGLPVKLHISLHYTNDTLRKKWMPKSMDIKSTIIAAEFYKQKTGNPVEIHYALIDGVNDTIEDAKILTDLIKDKGFNVKFLFYNEKTSLGLHPSEMEKYKMFEEHLNTNGISTEYYKPPGLDIGASCGQFLMEEYETDE